MKPHKECSDCGLCSVGETPAKTFNKIILFLYFIPALLLLLGFIIGYLLKGNLGGFVVGLFFLIAGYAVIRKLTISI